MQNKTLLIVLLFVLSSCSSTTTRVVSDSKPVPVIHPVQPRQPDVKNLNIKVITSEDAGYVKELKERVLVVFDLENFEKLGYNIAELVRYIKQQEETIQYYRNIAEND